MQIAPLELQAIGQILLAVVLGGVLGIQRERSGKSAGPRTYALVTAGAALVTVIALSFNSPVMMGQILTGIGFLGAGTILHKGNDSHIEGLTTAAGLWITAAIGMAIGAQYFMLSIATTFLILLVLMLNDQRFKIDSGRK